MNFTSADLKQEFTSPMFKPAAPKQEVVSQNNSAKYYKGSAFDQREAELVKENGGDPIINH